VPVGILSMGMGMDMLMNVNLVVQKDFAGLHCID
jgi:hypothetical protein